VLLLPVREELVELLALGLASVTGRSGEELDGVVLERRADREHAHLLVGAKRLRRTDGHGAPFSIQGLRERSANPASGGVFPHCPKCLQVTVQPLLELNAHDAAHELFAQESQRRHRKRG